MRYTRSNFKNIPDDEPFLFVSAFDENGDEVMRVVEYHSGIRLYADCSNTLEDGIWLESLTLDDVLNFSDPDEEVLIEEIDQETFEKYWNVPENKKFTQFK